jgi:hypothetical protein
LDIRTFIPSGWNRSIVSGMMALLLVCVCLHGALRRRRGDQ